VPAQALLEEKEAVREALEAEAQEVAQVRCGKAFSPGKYIVCGFCESHFSKKRKGGGVGEQVERVPGCLVLRLSLLGMHVQAPAVSSAWVL
jgi:hypothetical protein